MCGRYSLSGLHGEIVQQMVVYPDIDVSETEWIDEDNFMPRYNIAPRSNAPVIRRGADGALVMHTMKWGVIPHWSKHEDFTLNTINARAENLLEPGGMWASIKSKKRCLVACDGYYEWLKKGKDRLPHFVRRKDSRLLILAGLYDSVVLEGASTPLWTFSIVTTDAAPSFSWLHDRQPVILSTTNDFEAWLGTGKGWHAGLAALLKPGDGSDLECYPVPKEVGKVGTNSPSFIQPISQRKDGIEAMFAKQTAKDSVTSQTKPSRMKSSPVTDVRDNSPVVNLDKTPKRLVEDDPPSSPLSSQSPSKKQKFSQEHRKGNANREVNSPTKKSSKPDPGGFSSPPSGSHVEFTAEEPRTKLSKPRTKSREKSVPSTPKKKNTKPGSDVNSAKITSFFRPQI